LTSLHMSVHTVFDFNLRFCGNAQHHFVVFVPPSLPMQEMRISGSLDWPRVCLRNQFPPTVTKLQLDSSNSVEEAVKIVGTLNTLPEDLRELVLVQSENAISAGEVTRVEEEYIRAMEGCQRQGVELMRRPAWLVDVRPLLPVIFTLLPDHSHFKRTHISPQLRV
jgi:hypothetical protein